MGFVGGGMMTGLRKRGDWMMGMSGSGGRKRIERETRDSTQIWYRASTQG